MKKKDLLKNISDCISAENSEEISINNLTKDFILLLAKIGIVSLLIYVVFSIYALVNIDFAGDLSNVSANNYLIMTIILLVISLIVGALCVSLYIYNRNKKCTFSLKHLKIFYNFYQYYDIVNFIGVFLTVFLWMIVFMVTPVEISGQSMEDTLSEGDKVLVWRFNYEPSLYDIVVIDANEHYQFTENTEFVIKRIMANSGDSVSLTLNGIYSINGRPVRQNISVDEFMKMLTDTCTGEVYYRFDEESAEYVGVVPEGYCIVLGDNRVNSMDSKSVGLIHNEDILGKAIFRIYPFNKIGVPIGEMK